MTPRPPSACCDVDGTPITGLCRIQLVAVDDDHRVLGSRLGKQGVVTAVGHDRVWVWFDRETLSTALGSHLVRVVPDPASRREPWR